jgi:prepilin-type N-terminal cleavage/methylation domain-containing protein
MQCTKNGKTDKSKQIQSGFSLVEMIVSMFVLTLLSLGFIKGLVYTKYMAEDNLYEASALSVAVSTIEQMKGASISLLSTPSTSGGKEIFTLTVENSNTIDLFLDEVNTMSIPLVTDSDGNVQKYLELEVTPSIDAMDSATGYWLSLKYSYKHPRTGRIRTAMVRNARSTVPTN